MLALKFLKQFLSDETFTNIQTNFRQQDYASLARNVHALKGLTGNLSMKKLFELTNIWMDDLRVQNYASTEEMYRCCEREYLSLIHILAVCPRCMEEISRVRLPS